MRPSECTVKYAKDIGLAVDNGNLDARNYDVAIGLIFITSPADLTTQLEMHAYTIIRLCIHYHKIVHTLSS